MPDEGATPENDSSKPTKEGTVFVGAIVRDNEPEVASTSPSPLAVDGSGDGRHDAIALMLRDKRSANTRYTYRTAYRDFFEAARGEEPEAWRVVEFLSLSVHEIARALANYKGSMLERGFSAATINNRLAALKSLLNFAYRWGWCATSGHGLIDGEKVRAYRDTRGISLEQMQLLLRQPAAVHPKGSVARLRDMALLRLLCENALRRAEVCALDMSDFDFAGKRLSILGKGRGTQKEIITLSPKCAGAIRAYLIAAGHDAHDRAEPSLFRNLHHDPRIAGGRLTADGLYKIVAAYGERIGYPNLSPHKLRHSSITAMLEMPGADPRNVQKVSRHSNLNTLMIYDDARKNVQGEMTNRLSELL